MAEAGQGGEVVAGPLSGAGSGDWAPATRDTPTRARAAEAAVFLDGIARGLTPTGAARAAGIGRAVVYRWRESDPDFRQAWETAHAAMVDGLERSAIQRAAEGWDEPVWYQGRQVGTVRKFSDRLLELVLKAERPDKYRERVDHQVTAVPLSPEEIAAARAAALSPEVEAAARTIASLPVIEGTAHEA